MRVSLLCRFEDTPDRNAILEFIAKLTDESTKTLTDDGVSQTVQGKIGLATFGAVKVPSPASLAPIRSFVEIVQPVGSFIFRLRKGPMGPEAALFEIFTDWESEAAKRLRDHILDLILPLANTISLPVYA
jgi:hypothetical protein